MIHQLMMGIPNPDVKVDVPGATLAALSIYPALAKVEYALLTDGTTNATVTDSMLGSPHLIDLEDWISTAPFTDVGDDYHVRFHVTSVSSGDLGSIGGSGLDVWLPLTTNKVVTMSSTDGYKHCNILVEISDDGGTSVVDSDNVFLNVDSSN